MESDGPAQTRLDRKPYIYIYTHPILDIIYIHIYIYTYLQPEQPDGEHVIHRILKTSTQHPKPETLNPKPSTLNPKPLDPGLLPQLNPAFLP